MANSAVQLFVVVRAADCHWPFPLRLDGSPSANLCRMDAFGIDGEGGAVGALMGVKRINRDGHGVFTVQKCFLLGLLRHDAVGLTFVSAKSHVDILLVVTKPGFGQVHGQSAGKKVREPLRFGRGLPARIGQIAIDGGR